MYIAEALWKNYINDENLPQYQILFQFLNRTECLPKSGINFAFFRTIAGAVSDKVTITSRPNCLHESSKEQSETTYKSSKLVSYFKQLCQVSMDYII